MDESEKNLPRGVTQETMDRWNNMDQSEICKGLWALRDWIKYNTDSAWRNEHRLLSEHDHTYFQKVLRGAEEKLTGEPPKGHDHAWRTWRIGG